MKTIFNKLRTSFIAITLICIYLPDVKSQALVTAVEAEAGIIEGGLRISKATAGYSGTGYVNNFQNISDKLTVTVNVPTRNNYKIVFRYNSPFGNKNQTVYVNGSGTKSVVFPLSSSFVDVDAGIYSLNAGSNTITLQADWGWIDVDRVGIFTTAAKLTYNIDQNPVNPNANQETKLLYNYLISTFNVKIISGMTDSRYDSVKAICGKSPMLRAFDFQHYTEGYPYLWNNAISGHSFGAEDDGQVQRAITWYNQTGKKGIVSFQWHWHSPSGGALSTNTFYTQYSTFDVSKAVVIGTTENTLIIRDIDAIAVQLIRLQNAGVPVLWRPLHEAGGAWFWWGAKGAVSCKKLYDIMYERMTNFHGLNNLIWVWSTPETSWYPGNDKIDIVGYDSYPGAYNYDARKAEFNTLYALSNGKKIIAMTENGPIPNPTSCMSADAPWSYFMTWSSLLTEQNSKQHIIDAFSNPNVLTLEDVTAVKEIVSRKLKYLIYPNPSNGKVNISGSDFDRLEVIDLNGKIIRSINKPYHAIDTQGLLNGSYFLRFYSNNEIFTQKLIVSK